MPNNGTLPSTQSRTIAIIAAIILSTSAIWLIILAYANITANNAISTLDAWKKQRKVPEASALKTTHDALSHALKFDSGNPEYLAEMARLHLLRSAQHNSQSPESSDAIETALYYYQQALTVVPSWPYYWAGVIQTRHAKGLYDNLMNHSLQSAARFGPWFVENQNIILRAGIPGWPYLAPESQAAVSGTLHNAIQLQPEEVISQSIDHGYSSNLKPVIMKDDGLKIIYKRELYLRKHNVK